jgi:hypothetical protein
VNRSPRRYVFFFVVRVVRFAAEAGFDVDRAVEVLRALVERDDAERPAVPDARDVLVEAADRDALDLPVVERDVVLLRALVERDAVERPVVPEREDPDFAVEREPRDVVDLLAAGFRAVVPDARVLAVLRAEVLRVDVVRDPELDVVAFFLAGPVEVLRCLGNLSSPF